MAHYYTDIKAGIVLMLQNATKAKVVYDYEETKPSGYPCITVTPLEGEAEFLDTVRVRRDFTFSVRIYQERLEATPSGAESIITSMVDQILALCDDFSNTTLSNTVVFLLPVKTKWGYLQAPDADVRSCEITLIGEAAQ